MLVDIKRDGRMRQEEFMIAMHLVKRRSSGEEIPTSLPPSIQPTSPQSPNTPSSSTSSPSNVLAKKQPPPVPPKRRDSLLKGTNPFPVNSKYSSSATISPPVSSPALNQSVERSQSFRSSNSSVTLSSSLSSGSSPFEDPEHLKQPLSETRAHSPPPPPPPPPPPSTPPLPVDIYQKALDKYKDEISTLSNQVESQSKTQNRLWETNEALRLENEILKTQVKETERMMSEVFVANELESREFRDRFEQEITQLMGKLEEKENECGDHHRRITVLCNEERELREKLRESEGTLAKSITEAVELRQVIDSKKDEIEDLKGRISVMTKALSEESGSSRYSGMNHRELKVLIRDVTKENEGLKGRVRDMERSMEQLLLSTRQAKYNEIESENRKLKMQVRELESVVTQLQSSVSPSASWVQKAENLARENQKMQSQLQDGKRVYADYRSTTESRIVEMEQQLEALKQENTRLKVDIHAATEGRREEGTLPPPGYDEPFVAPPV